MDTLILENFRCFADRTEIPIRPLTLLVGENSTGKTSFLAAVRAAHDLRSRAALDFNEEPFRLGSYDQIANYRGGRAGRARSYTVGQQFTTPARRRGQRRHARDSEIRMEARFTSVKSQPTISDLSISSGEHALQLRILESDQPVLSFAVGDQVIFERKTDESLWAPRALSEDLWFTLRMARHEAEEDTRSSMTKDAKEHLDRLIESVMFQREPRPYAFAPIRANPQRTYDPAREIRDPEGSHTPMMLARLLDNGDTSEFRDHVEQFGAVSGLYSSLGVRKLGRQGSDPFQIEVKHPGGGRARNLVDVGYGVSQAIPIIADCVSAERGSTLLIQQPEVHLHPRAQAAMGSFFAQLADSGRNRLVVETHSDYLVDRVRMDVRDEKIRATDVVILYFEQAKGGVGIHPIALDAEGRVSGVPEGYRSFFLEEDRRFFGVGQ